MKKVFTFFAAMVMLASVSFSQTDHRIQPGEKPTVAPAPVFKPQLKKVTNRVVATKSVGDTISQFPWFEDFEAGTLPTGFSLIDADNDGYCWTVYDFGTTGNGHNGSEMVIASASYINNVGAITPDDWMILPAFEIPTSGTDLTLRWFEKGQDANYAEEYYTVYISTSGRNVTDFTAATAVYSGLSSSEWVKKTVDLSAYAGQTIHIAFRHHNSTDMFYLDIDDIRVGGPEPPELSLYGPSAARMNYPVTFYATSNVNTLSWYVDGSLDASTVDSMTTVFTTVGMHEVVVEATNAVGTVSDTLMVDIFSCEDIALPYEPNFNGGLGCWDSRSDSTNGTGWFTSVYVFSDNVEGQVVSISAQNYGFFVADISVDNWLISPEMEMPTTGDEYEIAWQVKPYESSLDGDHYGVYVINDGDTNLLFEESLTGMTDYTQRMAIIPSTVSGDFQVAFRHFNNNGGYVIILDSIQIRALTAPQVTLTAPIAVETGNPFTVTATAPNASSFTWTVDGLDVPETSNVLTISLDVDGFHTIAVEATNSEGSDFDTVTVEAYTCEAISVLPYTQGFETGIRCWNVVTADAANDDRIGVDTNHFTGSYGFRFSSYSRATDYNQYLISPELSLPEGGEYMVKFMYKGYTSAESFRVLVSTTTNDIASFDNVMGTYERTATDWTEVAFLLPQETKYIAIDYYGEFQYYLYIDDITVKVLDVAPTVILEGPESSETGEAVSFVANAPLATSFTWEVDGASVNTTSNTITVPFGTAGSHTVQVVATNSVGSSAPAYHTINVFSCEANTEFPWVMDFESATGYECWKFIDADGDGYNWNTDYLRDFVDDETGMPNPQGHNNSNGMVGSASYANAALTPDNWMILPAMTLPAESNLVLTWYEKGQDPSYANEHYSVYISTTGRNVSDFLTPAATYTSQAEWIGRNVELSQYAGQTIYIAFRHYDCTDMFYLDIDDIMISTEHVGINEVDNSVLSLYPNPASTMVAVSAEGVEGNVTVQIVDLNGRVMMQQQGNAQSFRFDVSTLAQGAYFVRMTGENVNTVRKLVVK